MTASARPALVRCEVGRWTSVAAAPRKKRPRVAPSAPYPPTVERRTACDRAGEVAELHRRRAEAGHGRPQVRRSGERERARDQRARAGGKRGGREEGCARSGVRTRKPEEAVGDGEADGEQDEESPWFVSDEAPEGQIAGDVCTRRDREQAPRQPGGGPVRFGEERARVDERSRPGGVREQLGRQPSCEAAVAERGASACGRHSCRPLSGARSDQDPGDDGGGKR